MSGLERIDRWAALALVAAVACTHGDNTASTGTSEPPDESTDERRQVQVGDHCEPAGAVLISSTGPLGADVLGDCRWNPGYGLKVIEDQAGFDATVDCSYGGQAPNIDFEAQRLVGLRVPGYASYYGASHDAEGGVTRLHVITTSSCGGAAPPDLAIVDLLPADGSEIVVDECHEPVECGEDPRP